MNVSETIRPTEPRARLQPYVKGALLALALTLAPFAMVMSGASVQAPSRSFSALP